jgi:hypothetical protein
VGTRSLSSGAHSRDPLASPTLRLATDRGYGFRVRDFVAPRNDGRAPGKAMGFARCSPHPTAYFLVRPVVVPLRDDHTPVDKHALK